MNLKPVLGGIKSRFVGKHLHKNHTCGTSSARYCYSVWLRHLVLACRFGLPRPPLSIVELGPGDSIGMGLAALLCGANRYYALDVVKHACTESNRRVFEELIELFAKRVPIPGPDEFPVAKPYLENYNFPHGLLSADHLAETLRADRLARIRESILALGNSETPSSDGPEIEIRYIVPWDDLNVASVGSVDMAISQATMEHVPDIGKTYRSLNAWLKPGGFMTHQIDFKSHGTAKEWNGQWSYPDWIWSLVRALINRSPCSEHETVMAELGFRVLHVERVIRNDGLKRSKLARKYKTLSELAMTTSSAFLCAQSAQGSIASTRGAASDIGVSAN